MGKLRLGPDDSPRATQPAGGQAGLDPGLDGPAGFRDPCGGCPPAVGRPVWGLRWGHPGSRAGVGGQYPLCHPAGVRRQAACLPRPGDPKRPGHGARSISLLAVQNMVFCSFDLSGVSSFSLIKWGLIQCRVVVGLTHHHICIILLVRSRSHVTFHLHSREVT